MSRLKELRKYVDAQLNKMEDADKRTSAVAHLYGVSLAATMIAKKRGLDPEIASMAAMLHDLHAYKTGSYEDHVISHCLHDTSKAIKEKGQKR